MDALRNPLPTLSPREKRLGLCYLIFELFVLPTVLQSVNAALGTPLHAALLNFLYFSVNCIATVLIFGRFLKKNLLRFLRAPKENLLYAVAGFAVYWVCKYLLSLLTGALFPSYENPNDASIWEMVAESPVFMIVGTVVLVPIAEETLHRGLVFGALYERKPIAAYFISAAVFAAIHVISMVGTYPIAYLALMFLQYLPAGLIFARCYRAGGSLATPILIHMANNAALFIFTR